MTEPIQDVSSPAQPPPGSRWDPYIWPRWLPIRARLPLIAQLCGVAALIAAVAMPTLEDAPSPPAAVAGATATVADEMPEPPAAVEPIRPAHLNLDVRHTFKSVHLTVSIDDTRMLDTRLEGSGKKFGVFGKRDERSYARTFELEPGVRLVRVRVHAPGDKFDQTRVERFELGSATVASLRLVVEKEGLAIFADRPPVVRAQPPAPPRRAAVVPLPAVPAAPAVPAPPRSVLVELYLTLRSVLIAMAGFVATTAAAYIIEVFLNSRKRLLGL